MDNVLPVVLAWGSMYLPRIIAAILIFVIGRWFVVRLTKLVCIFSNGTELSKL